MTDKRRLTEAEWAQVRARWEGSPQDGFGWLVDEILKAWGIEIGRTGLVMTAKRKGWEKTKVDIQSEPLKPSEAPFNVPSQQPPLTPSQASVTPPVTPTPDWRQKLGLPSPGGPKGKPKKAAPPPAPPRYVPTGKAGPDITDVGPDGRPLPPGEQPSQPPSQPPAAPWITPPLKAGTIVRYRKEFADELLRFFNIDAAEAIPKDYPINGVAAQTSPPRFPTFERFASNIGVTAKTLMNWAQKLDDQGELLNPEFHLAYARARDMQAALVIEGGMTGVWADKFAALASKNLAGWQDRVVLTATDAAVSRSELEERFVTNMAIARENQLRIANERLQKRGVLPESGSDA